MPASEATTTRSALGSVFVGGPFVNLVDPALGRMSDRDQARYTGLIEYFENLGATVYNAHRREAWGAEFLGPLECTERDYNEIAASDLFIAYPGVPVSPGTHVECGWASALGKPMILLLEKNEKHTFLVTGLPSIANVEYIWFDDPAEVLGELDAALERVMARSGPSGAAQ
jgi:hypothetical protein